MKNRKLLGILLVSVMLMASGCNKDNGSSPETSNTDPSVTDAAVVTDENGDVKPGAGEENNKVKETEPVVTRADGAVIDGDEIGDDYVESKPAETEAVTEPAVTKEQRVELVEDDDIVIEAGDSEGMADIIAAAVSEDKDSGYEAPDISGTWVGGQDEANNISISKVEGNVYKAAIIVNTEKGAGTLWELVLRYQDDKFVYSDGKKYTFDTNGGSLNSTENYSDGTGSLRLEDGHLTWTDDKENTGEGLVFEKQ